MEAQSKEEQPPTSTETPEVGQVVDEFVSSLFIPDKPKLPPDGFITSSLKREKPKKKMVKNRSIDYKSDFSLQNFTKDKPSAGSGQLRNLNLSEDRIISSTMEVNYEDVTQAEKEMKLYLKRVEAFTNRINALRKQESELSNQMGIMQKKEKAIEQIHCTKRKLKDVLSKNKTDINREREVLKEQVMMKKLTHQDKLEQFRRENEMKKRQNIEIAKASQTLVKSMISQTNTKTETMNKYKYLQVKEGFAQFKADEQQKQTEKEELKKEGYIKKVIGDKELIEKLKEKCDELEKIEEECFEKLKTTKAKSNYFQSIYALAAKVKTETMNHLNSNTTQVSHTATTNNTNSHNSSNKKQNAQKVIKADNEAKKKALLPPRPQMVVKMKKHASTSKVPTKPIVNRPQSSKAKPKENEASHINNPNYFTNYKVNSKAVIKHKMNETEAHPVSSPPMKNSTIA